MNKNLKKLKKANTKSVIKFAVLLTLCLFVYNKIRTSFEAILDNNFVAKVIEMLNLTKTELISSQDKIELFFLALTIYNVFEIVLNFISYFAVKKTKSKMVAFIFGFIKFITLSWFSGITYMFMKKIKEEPNYNNGYSSYDDGYPQCDNNYYSKKNYMPSESFNDYEEENYNYQNQLSQNKDTTFYPRVELERHQIKRIFLAILLFILFFGVR